MEPLGVADAADQRRRPLLWVGVVPDTAGFVALPPRRAAAAARVRHLSTSEMDVAVPYGASHWVESQCKGCPWHREADSGVGFFLAGMRDAAPLRKYADRGAINKATCHSSILLNSVAPCF